MKTTHEPLHTDKYSLVKKGYGYPCKFYLDHCLFEQVFKYGDGAKS
jgi:hypothetical protein